MSKKTILFVVLCLLDAFYANIVLALPLRRLHINVSFLTVEPNFQYKIIPAPHNTWGYDILRNNQIYIHQPNRPGLPGVEGFSTKRDAIKVAKLVLAKINKGEMPPTISPGELKALKITY